MPTQQEIDKVIEWCKKKKEEKMRTPIIEENPFQDMMWMRNKVRIEIDMPFTRANKYGVVYDSPTNALWECVQGEWRRITAML